MMIVDSYCCEDVLLASPDIYRRCDLSSAGVVLFAPGRSGGGVGKCSLWSGEVLMTLTAYYYYYYFYQQVE